MTKEELFARYNINESHSEWNYRIDNWMSVEIYRIMHNGALPQNNDISVKWIVEFLDKIKDTKWWTNNVMCRKDWGSLLVTAKRLVYSLAEDILKEINQKEQ